MSTDQLEAAASVTIVPLGYCARGSEPGCRDLGSLILRYADARGRPMNNADSVTHTAGRGLRVPDPRGLKIYDDRQVRG